MSLDELTQRYTLSDSELRALTDSQRKFLGHGTIANNRDPLGDNTIIITKADPLKINDFYYYGQGQNRKNTDSYATGRVINYKEMDIVVEAEYLGKVINSPVSHNCIVTLKDDSLIYITFYAQKEGS